MADGLSNISDVVLKKGENTQETCEAKSVVEKLVMLANWYICGAKQ